MNKKKHSSSLLLEILAKFKHKYVFFFNSNLYRYILLKSCSVGF